MTVMLKSCFPTGSILFQPEELPFIISCNADLESRCETKTFLGGKKGSQCKESNDMDVRFLSTPPPPPPISLKIKQQKTAFYLCSDQIISIAPPSSLPDSLLYNLHLAIEPICIFTLICWWIPLCFYYFEFVELCGHINYDDS
ncbi:uncharacterized protein LOC132691042 isoform X2 [Panthera onca]